MSNQLNYQININGNFAIAIDKFNTQVNSVSNSVLNLDNSVNNSFNKISGKLNNIEWSSVINLCEKASQAINSLAAPGVGFQQNMADLSSITGIAGKDLDELGKIARKTGKDSGLGAGQAAQAFAILASQIQVDKIGMSGLVELQQKTITLSQAAGMSMNDAANALAGTINQFGLQATEAERVVNVLAAGSKYGAAEIVDLAQSFKVVGAAANAAGLSVESTAGAVEVLSKNNLKGAEAGTALRNIVLKMQTTLGVDFSKNSLSDALNALKPKLKDATYLSKVFGMENIAAAQFLIANSDAVAEMTTQVTDTNVAQEQAAIRTETVAAKMERMRAAVDNVKIGIFDLLGGFSAWVSVGGEQLVMLSQLIPLITALGTGIKWLTNIENLKTIASGIATGATGLWTAAQWALNAAFTASPIGFLIMLSAGLSAAIVWAWNSFEGFRGAILGTWEVLKLFGSILWDTILGAVNNLIGGLGSLGTAIMKLFKGDFKGAADAAVAGAKQLFAASPVGMVVSATAKVTNADWGAAWDKGQQNAVSAENGSQKLQGIATPARSGNLGLSAGLSATPADGSTGAAGSGKRGMNMSKFCDQIVINIKDAADPTKVKESVISALHEYVMQYDTV